VLENLSDRYTPFFDAGRAAVAERLAALKSDNKLFQERKAASNKERQERDEAALDGQHGEIATTEEAMQSHLELLRDTQRESNVTKLQLDALRSDRTRLSAQIVTVQAQIDALQPPAQIVVNVSPNGSATAVNTSPIGPRARDRLLTNPQYSQIFALSMYLGRLNKQAFDMDRRLLSLQQRSAELSDRSLRDADELDRHDAAVQKTAKRAKALEKKINRESAAPKASTPALNSQMTALSTYLPFPYEQERKRVLAWFEK
jgi:septal ring factor EnvC (AmiA/AmiB activator)